MKYLAVLLLGLLAGGCFAIKSGFKVSIDKINVELVADEYVKGANCGPVPTLEYGDVSAGKFKEMLTTAVWSYGVNLLQNVADQAIEDGNRFVSLIENYTHELLHSIKSWKSHNKQSVSMNDALGNLTSQLETILSLGPGNAKVKRGVPPLLPKQQVEVKSKTTRRTLEELFVNPDLIIYDLTENVFGYMTGLFLTSWRYEIPSYDVFRSQIRKQILNDKVLAACKTAVDKVYKHKDSVRKHVRPETWKRFKNAGDRITAISNDYTDTSRKVLLSSRCPAYIPFN